MNFSTSCDHTLYPGALLPDRLQVKCICADSKTHNGGDLATQDDKLWFLLIVLRFQRNVLFMFILICELCRKTNRTAYI